MDTIFSLPFDQYQRYKVVSDVINKFRNGEEKFKILDVGAGFEENLKKFLPSDEIYCLDKEYPPEFSRKGRFIPGDIFEKKFDEKYDFVVTIDVYEHIPSKNRKKFIDILIPLSKIATIIAAPFNQDEVWKCEYFANEVYKTSHGRDYIWLKEHIENGLPSLTDTQNLIKDSHFNPVIIPNGFLPRWFEMICIFLLTEGQEEFQPMIRTLYEFYNQNYYQYDNRNPAYRQTIIILKGNWKIDFSDLTAKKAEPEQLINQNLLLESFFEKIIRSYQYGVKVNQRDIEIKNRQLEEKSAQTRILELDITEKNSQLFKMSTQIQDFIIATTAKDAQLGQMAAEIQTLKNVITAKDTLIFDIDQKIKSLDQILTNKDQQLEEAAANRKSLQLVLNNVNLIAEEKQNQIDVLNKMLSDKESEIDQLNITANQLKKLNDTLTSSISYRLVMKFHSTFIESLFPPMTRRRELYDFGLKGGKIAINQGVKKAWSDYRIYRSSRKRNQIAAQEIPPSNIPDKPIRENSYSHIDQTVIHLHEQKNNKPPEYVPYSQDHVSLFPDDIKFIAFYLPQFHPIPENDRWWGKGFTEWTNVAKALPKFVGHYQPHLPDELGFYDLRLPEIQKRQIELARHYGIFGFCFYYYWFNGKRLLERPLDQFIKNEEFNFPFCICWANENWTRRWDGLDNEILISQIHSPENDIHFIQDIEEILRDPRYIRINGKPLILVYRVTLLPEAKETARRWREYCISSGIGEIYLVAALTFGCEGPEQYGFDAAVEFPPHTITNDCINITEKMKLLDPKFSGYIFDFEEFIRSKKYLKDLPYIHFKTVSPGWDNTARRADKGSVFHGANPQLYKQWLFDVTKLTKETHPLSERIVFINAWNEWAEGTHLEPDRKFGYGYLQATADVIRENREPVESIKKKIIIVSHDALYHGAQLLALHLAIILKEQFNYEVFTILKGGGILEEEFKKHSHVLNFERDYPNNYKKNDIISRLYQNGFNIAIANTVVSGDIVELLSKNQIKTLSLIHELPGIINQMKQESNFLKIIQHADKIVFPSNFVKEKTFRQSDMHDKRSIIAPQGLYVKNTYKKDRTEAKKKLRKFLSVPADAKIVICVGFADYRKGADIFIHVAQEVIQNNSNVYFIWIGHTDIIFIPPMQRSIIDNGLKEKIRFIGIQDDISMFYAGADLFLLTSREDPFPSVVLEALDVELPVIGFEGAGGFSDILKKGCGLLVPYLNINAMVDKVQFLLSHQKICEDMGRKGREIIEIDYQLIDYVYLLLGLLGHNYKKVSVIIPNFNYEKYLKARTDSILEQDYPIYEIIFLDDCSTDNSVDFIEDFADHSVIRTIVIKNKKNSGSVFNQWAKGIAYTKGDYVWIAEVDDLSEKTFLNNVIEGFYDERVILSYSQSKQIDENSQVIAPDYYNYTDDVDKNKWRSNYIREGIDEIIDSLAIKNTIPNVSAVVFKKIDISTILDDLTKFKVAGDWFFYVWLLQKGKIAFNAQSLNLHRRHKKAVTISENAQRHFDEIVKMQEFICKNFPISEITKTKVMDYRKTVKKYLLG